MEPFPDPQTDKPFVVISTKVWKRIIRFLNAWRDPNFDDDITGEVTENSVRIGRGGKSDDGADTTKLAGAKYDPDTNTFTAVTFDAVISNVTDYTA